MVFRIREKKLEVCVCCEWEKGKKDNVGNYVDEIKLANP